MANNSNLSTSTLTAYINANSAELMRKGLLASRTVQLVDVKTGIKASETTFAIESTTLVVQTANNGIVPSGTTTITPITVSIDRLATREGVGQDTLETYFESKAFKAGQSRDDSSLNNVAPQYVAEKLNAIGYEIDRILWQSNKTTGTGNLKQSDGFIAKFVSASGSTQNIAKTAITETNAIVVCKAYFDALPNSAKTRTDLTMFVGHDEFISIQSAMVPTNYFPTSSESPRVYTIDFKYRPMMIEAISGLNGTNRKFVGPKSFLKIGTDLATDMPAVDGGSGLRWWFSQDDEIHYFQSRWAQGVGIGIPSFFVNDIL